MSSSASSPASLSVSPCGFSTAATCARRRMPPSACRHLRSPSRPMAPAAASATRSPSTNPCAARSRRAPAHCRSRTAGQTCLRRPHRPSSLRRGARSAAAVRRQPTVAGRRRCRRRSRRNSPTRPPGRARDARPRCSSRTTPLHRDSLCIPYATRPANRGGQPMPMRHRSLRRSRPIADSWQRYEVKHPISRV